MSDKLNAQAVEDQLRNSFSEVWSQSKELDTMQYEEESLISEIKEFYWGKFLKATGFEDKDLKIWFCPPADEVCIYYKKRYLGYFDEYLIEVLETMEGKSDEDIKDELSNKTTLNPSAICNNDSFFRKVNIAESLKAIEEYEKN